MRTPSEWDSGHSRSVPPAPPLSLDSGVQIEATNLFTVGIPAVRLAAARSEAAQVGFLPFLDPSRRTSGIVHR